MSANIEIIKGVRCYIDENNVAQLNLEDVARGLGFTTETVSATSGKKYVNVRWGRVQSYLESFGFSQDVGKDVFIPEPIFYLLSMKAENVTARSFQNTIAYDVLPTIRRHGAYMTPETIEKALTDPDTIIQLATTLKEERAARKALEAQAEADKPKALFADAVAAAKTSILVGELAKLIKQNGIDIGQNRLFRWLRENGYLIRRKGTDFNMPTQRAMEQGLFEIKETTINNPDGSIRVTKTPKVTGKGQGYFVNLFLGERVG